jgi:ferric-dicitrate binding protein FerR (iron transport regulator)
MVHTSDVIVTVHGTKFNIESYEDDKDVAVTLEEGKIDYYNISMNRLYSMKPNDYIWYNKESGKLKVDVVQPEKYNAWKDGKLVFRNDPLDIVAKRLGRWYNVEVEIIGNISNQPMLRATFVDEKLEEVLRFLKLSLPVDYTIMHGEKAGDTLQKTKVVISSKTK